MDILISGFGSCHPWTGSLGRRWNLSSVWFQPGLTLARADDHSRMGELTIATALLTLTQVIVLSSSLLGHKLGDPPAPWFDAATNACGGILYIVTGALVVDFYTNALGPPPARDAGLAMGSFSLITGLCTFICAGCALVKLETLELI